MIKKVSLVTLHIVALICMLMYAAVQFMKLVQYESYPFIFSYLNDILVIPIIATICLHVLWMVKKNYQLRIGVLSLISLVVLYSYYFEYYLPLNSERYTRDVWDIGCYVAGAVIFYIAQKLP
ncbi:hypothetical protein [Nonlabens ulvanivorans]|uniref:hypothetical protein n=1 Tax=Nonlabens ulvanivorans TaxID=906888 RepID=UPI0037C6AB9B